MTRLYAINNVPDDKLSELDTNFDGATGLGENEGAVYKNNGQGVVDFDAFGFAAFKEKFIERFTINKSGNITYTILFCLLLFVFIDSFKREKLTPKEITKFSTINDIDKVIQSKINNT